MIDSSPRTLVRQEGDGQARLMAVSCTCDCLFIQQISECPYVSDVGDNEVNRTQSCLHVLIGRHIKINHYVKKNFR